VTARACAVTGTGVVSPLGVGRAAFRAALAERGPTGVGAFRSDSSVLSPERVREPSVAEVFAFDPTLHLGDKGLRNFDRLTKFLLVAAKLALEDAGLKANGAHTIAPERIGVCSATAYGSIDAITELVSVAELEDPRFVNPNRFPNTVINSAAGYVGIWEDLRAPNVTVVDGNCGALDAVLACQTHLDHGRADAFLVGGGEALSEALYLAFRRLGVLAEGARPFRPGDPDSGGMRLGEGAAYLCVERAEHAQARGAAVLGRLLGYGNAFEPPESEAMLVHASARAVERTVRMALADASLAPADVDVVCGSLSGLAPFDQAELQALRTVFGPEVCVAAPKALFGESFGAGGAFAMGATLAWLGGVPVAPIVSGRPPAEVRRALVVAVGFYGNVSAVVLGR
jgi:3-oxoacyl-(acyl-carrier-protein) synthase